MWTVEKLDKETLLNKTLEELDKHLIRSGISDFYSWLFSYKRGLFSQIRTVESKIIYFQSGDIEAYKELLREYWKLHMEGIKAYKSETKPKTTGINIIEAEMIIETRNIIIRETYSRGRVLKSIRLVLPEHENYPEATELWEKLGGQTISISLGEKEV